MKLLAPAFAAECHALHTYVAVRGKFESARAHRAGTQKSDAEPGVGQNSGTVLQRGIAGRVGVLDIHYAVLVPRVWKFCHRRYGPISAGSCEYERNVRNDGFL